MRILIVEDEKALCDAIARGLRHLDYSVDCCYYGQSALDALSFERFDLVVLDLNLPDADGMTVLKTLRETDDETKVKVSVKASPMAMEHWAMQYINYVEVISPKALRESIKASINNGMNKYSD